MTPSNQLPDETIDALRELIEINTDSYKGYRTAADSISDGGLARQFREIADQREQHARTLQQHVDPDGAEAGSFKGRMHRWWLEARSAIQDRDAHAILAEVERGEDEILARYKELLGQAAGYPIHDVLMRQHSEVKQHHDKMRSLRDRHAES